MPISNDDEMISVEVPNTGDNIQIPIIDDGVTTEEFDSSKINGEEVSTGLPETKAEPATKIADTPAPAAAPATPGELEQLKSVLAYLNTPAGAQEYAKRMGLNVAPPTPAPAPPKPPELSFKFKDEDLQEVGPDGQVRYSPEKMMQVAFNQAVDWMKHQTGQIVDERFKQINPKLSVIDRIEAQAKEQTFESNKSKFVNDHKEKYPTAEKYVTEGTPEFQKLDAVCRRFPTATAAEAFAFLVSQDPSISQQVVDKKIQDETQRKVRAASIPSSGNNVGAPKKKGREYSDVNDLAWQIIRENDGGVVHSGL